MLANDSGILLPDHDADLEHELQGECSGPRSRPGQQQFLVRRRPPLGATSRGEGLADELGLAFKISGSVLRIPTRKLGLEPGVRQTKTRISPQCVAKGQSDRVVSRSRLGQRQVVSPRRSGAAAEVMPVGDVFVGSEFVAE